MACAAFPALMVTMPRSRCSFDSLDTAKTAPRGLNDPVRWKLSALRYAAVPMRSDSERLEKSGVRWRTGPTTSRARSTSATVTGIAASLAFKEPGPRTRILVEDGHPLGPDSEALKHPVEATDNRVRGNRGDPDRMEGDGRPPRLSDSADVAGATYPAPSSVSSISTRTAGSRSASAFSSWSRSTMVSA